MERMRPLRKPFDLRPDDTPALRVDFAKAAKRGCRTFGFDKKTSHFLDHATPTEQIELDPDRQ